MDLQRLLAFEGKSYSVLVNGCILEIVICVHCVKQTNWPWRGRPSEHNNDLYENPVLPLLNSVLKKRVKWIYFNIWLKKKEKTLW